MQKIRIGILDSEKEYVTKLSAYLQRYGGMRWEVSAFTSGEVLDHYLQKRKMDVLIGTNWRILHEIKTEEPLAKVFLSQESKGDCLQEPREEREKNLYSTYRFQSAKEIGRCLEGVIRQEQLMATRGVPMIAVYSPVGRCGKTSLMLEMVTCGHYGKWIYIGMEDYSSFEAEDCMETDIFWYYLKEKKERDILHHLKEVNGVVGSGTSYFDLRKIHKEDMEWLKSVLRNSDYRGVVFDIGSGVLESMEWLKEFDYWLVPYVEEKIAEIKIENLKRLIACSDMVVYRENIQFFNIMDKEAIQRIWKKVFGGDFI